MGNYKVSTTETRGRCLKATTAFQPGDTIGLFTNPIFSIPSSGQLSSQCSHCLRSDCELRLCTGCRAVSYCNVNCQRGAWKPMASGGGGHKHECPVLKLARERGGGRVLPTPTRALVAVMVNGKVAEERIKELEGNVNGFRQDARGWEDIRLQAYMALSYSKIVGPDNTDKYAEMLCKILTNTFNAYDPDVSESSVFLEPTLAMANHSCIPNATVQIEGREALLIAERPIAADEEIFISYINYSNSLKHRRVDLAKYHFTCVCPRCANDLDVYTVCKNYPSLTANEYSLVSAASLQSPAINRAIPESLERTYSNLQDDYKEFETSLGGPSKDTLKRGFAIVMPLVQANLWAMLPMPAFLNECVAYWKVSSEYPEDSIVALPLSCLIASRVIPATSPLPWSTNRLRTALFLCNTLYNAAYSVTDVKAKLDRLCIRVKLDDKRRHTIANAHEMSMNYLVAGMILHYKGHLHPESFTIHAANQLMTGFRASRGFENLDTLPEGCDSSGRMAAVRSWDEDKLRGRPWEAFWKASVVDVVEALAEVGARFIVQELGK
ncbi:SET domain and MYND-type zinc finger protein 6 [Ceratocystis platani]|uniref:SET domain and MYND-type zinc finger protein 6 n=1 Tax=Ceratocystis fimbriata f. sp. platani TaxID=88771 RepID=A0A0F8CSM8_CERFI|nr:SET domain and MYND-type zinc finger protein 6 [Ceratocystis platani]